MLRFRNVLIAARTVLLLAFGACVQTLGEFVPEPAAITDDRIVGDWASADDSTARTRIRRGDDAAYELLHVEGDRAPSRLRGRIGRLDGRLVLDVWPADDPADVAPLGIPSHMPIALELMGDSLRTRAFDRDSIHQAVRRRALRLTTRRVGEIELVLDSGRAVRDGIARALALPGMLAEPATWHRLPPGGFSVWRLRDPIPCFEPSPWREADLLFRRDPHWRGGDVASSVDLGGGRTLWLFGDSWIDGTGSGTRTGATMVGNSIAIQQGADPSSARVTFHWGRTSAGDPTDFFIDAPRAEKLWPGSGIRLDDRLLIFFARVRGEPSNALGFAIIGWAAALVENPDAEPSAWRVRWLDARSDPLGVTPGFASVVRDGRYLYAFGSQSQARSHPMHVVRWPLDAARRGDLGGASWWAGHRLQWVGDTSGAIRVPVFDGGQAELSIHRDAATGRWLSVQSLGFGAAEIGIRAAESMTGPWSEPRALARPSEYYRPRVMIYAAKAHPHLTGADLVATYVTNSTDFRDHQSDDALYYPRFVRLTRCP